MGIIDRILGDDAGKAERLTRKGFSLVYDGRYEESLGYFSEAIETDPGYAMAWCGKGAACSGLGEEDEAQKCFTTSLGIDGRSSETWKQKAVALRKMAGRNPNKRVYLEALTCAERALRYSPKSSSILHEKGLILHAMEKNDEAIAAFNLAKECNPEYSYPWVIKGEYLYGQRDYKESLTCFELAAKESPKDPEVWLGKGKTHIRLGQAGEALHCFRKVLKYDPSSIEARIYIAYAKRAKHLFAEAISVLEEAISLDEENETIKQDLVKTWLERGKIALYKAHKYDDAFHCFEEVLLLDPENPEAWFNRGVLLKRQGNYKEAENSFRHLLRLTSKNAAAWFELATIFDKMEEFGKAASCYRKVTLCDPTHLDAWLEAGSHLMKLGKNREAIISFEGAIRCDPKSSLAWYNHGVALRNLGKTREAEYSFERADELLKKS